jgi:hypothetical protein
VLFGLWHLYTWYIVCTYVGCACSDISCMYLPCGLRNCILKTCSEHLRHCCMLPCVAPHCRVCSSQAKWLLLQRCLRATAT